MAQRGALLVRLILILFLMLTAYSFGLNNSISGCLATLGEVVALLPVLGGLDSVAWGVVDGLGTTLDSALRGVVCAVDGTTDGLGGTEGLATEPLGVSEDAVRASLSRLGSLRCRCLLLSLSLKLSHVLLPVVGELLGEGLALLVGHLTGIDLSPEVVSEVVCLLSGVGGGGGGSEEGSVEGDAHFDSQLVFCLLLQTIKLALDYINLRSESKTIISPHFRLRKLL